MHRSDKVWPNAETFDPERFMNQPKDAYSFSFAPFSLGMPNAGCSFPLNSRVIGRRSCIGKRFALIEGTIALAMVARTYTISATDAPNPLPIHSILTLQTKEHVRLQLQRRAK